jgi:hypothetical protein
MRRFVLAAVIVLGGAAAASAERMSTRDIIELSKAGLGEEVLLALIDVNRGVYPIDLATLKQLKDAGVSDRVIAALVRSGRETPLPSPEPVPVVDPDPDDSVRHAPVVVIERQSPEVREVPVAVPVYVAVPNRGRAHRSHTVTVPQVEAPFVPFQSGPPAVRPHVEEPRKPVYWGFGGKLRPDAWGQKPEASQTEKDRGDRNQRDGKKK